VSLSYLDGVRAQPDNLRRSATVVRAALAGPVAAGAITALEHGTLVAFGMGASNHAATGFANVLRAAGRPAFALSAGDRNGTWHHYHYCRNHDLVRAHGAEHTRVAHGGDAEASGLALRL
jgi:hypothetical protein